MKLLTTRQKEILEFLKDFKTLNERPPTRVEIATKFGFRSANAAEEHLRALASKGVIRLVPGIARGIELN